MANDLNKVVLIGRLIRDPELRVIPSGTSIASFSIANSKNYLQQGERVDKVSFFNCIAWGKTGEIIAQYCKKGKQIAIEGRLQSDSWEDKETGKKRTKVEIVVDNFQFLSNAQSTGDTYNASEAKGSNAGDSGSVPDINKNQFDEDIPF
jgi:single-strand DNA-binding protein